MRRTFLLSVFALAIVHCYGAGQVQMPEAAEFNQPDDDLQAQIKALQQNVSDIWTYIYQLRTAVSNHLTHLRQHQAELESSMHTMEHLHESEMHSNDHHSGEQHSHGDDHSHGGEHSHSDEHSHGGEHSHSDEHHSHSGEHGHHSYSHSHTTHDHSEDHHHDHKDSHENEDVQSVIGSPAVAQPAPTIREEHYQHHHHHQHQQSFGPPAESVSVPTVAQSHHQAFGPPAESPVAPTVREEHYHYPQSPDSMNLLNEPFHHHHHHDHRHGSRNRNRTVELPRYSDYGQYDLALCRVEPNSALPENQQQDIRGTITMWQKKTGGPLNFHLRLQGFDVGHGDHHQAVQQEQDNEEPPTVGHRHGFHIHASGDLSNGCQSAGPHYNPKGVNHGAPRNLVRHVGDLGNIECDEHGNTNIMFSDDVASLRGQYSVIGKAIVIHATVDDLGLGGDAESLRTGNAGARLACCVIQAVEKIPIRQYKTMKTATQYQNR